MSETDTSYIGAMEAEYQQEAYRFCLAIRDEAKTYKSEDLDDGDGLIDVRLQIGPDGSYCFHSGDASYDQDHRGFWGAGTVSSDDGDQECAQIGRDLVEQAIDAALTA